MLPQHTPPESELATHTGLVNIALAISAQRINYNLPGINKHLNLHGKLLARYMPGRDQI
ncbi:hypothetical protein [Mycobacterium lepromatosis]|uniref:hypothetical protein n=1 Tax=Mycobacterium lepromatosis TaxID=480418 RepID=UPI001F19693C|nr:hypothetical protein [Mycobacterium lepromatosis]